MITRSHCYQWFVALSLLVSGLGLFIPAPLLAQAPPSDPAQLPDLSSAIVVSRGRGLLPGIEEGLTAAERSTVGHTVALVDALGELASLVTDSSPHLDTGETFTSEKTVILGEVLTISTQHIIKNKALGKATTTVSWTAHRESAIPSRIVVENWALVSPPVRHLDIYTLWRKVQEAGVVIDTWSSPNEGIVTLTLSAPRPQVSQPKTTPPVMTVLFTPEETSALQLTDHEWLLPLSTPTPSQGPRIRLQYPKAKRAGNIPLIETNSPATLRVIFEPNQAPIDMGSLKVKARKGFFKKSLTRFLKPYIRGTSIEAQNLKFPSGKFMIVIDIADKAGQSTSQSYYLHVSSN